ncbi:MAG TPA: efflux RND transporter periplasmic adaptor subunit [Holophagaceae bacterium]|nr:efflux RND transporter periplasmic adaptor subunit [Holophagaceae bacterium]
MNAQSLIPATALLLAGLACAKSEPKPEAALPTAAVRLVAGTGAGPDGWVAASLNPTNQATLSTRLAGTVKAVHVSEGARVAAGQLLLELEAGDLLGQLKAAETARDAAAAHYGRIQNLQAKGASTPSELEMAASNKAAAEGAVAAVKGQLAYAQIRAPFAGTVQRRDAQAGAFVGPGQPLITLEGTGTLELTASISEAEAAGLKVGRKVPFEVDGRPGEAQITALAVGGDPLTHRRALRAKVLKPSGLSGGAFARIQVPGAVAKAGGPVTVPTSALVTRGELSGVFVAEGGKAHLRWLSLGERSGANVEVRAGLNPGDAVIDAPKDLKDGQPVSVSGEVKHGQ